MISKAIDLRSDTMSRPNQAMLQAMVTADHGDDCYGENSTTRELEEYSAGLFGKEAGLFMPSGTMSNQVALKVLAPRGQEVLCDSDYHINFFEASPTSDLSGVAINAVSTPDGFLSPAIASRALETRARWTSDYATTSLVWTENTVNGRGGRVYPLARLTELHRWCAHRGIALYLDGARIMNAVAATGIPAADWGRSTDALAMCFAKGLGAPMGSVLMGSKAFIAEARRYRKWYGGALHQSGTVAAAALWALRNNSVRLADDHTHAALFASILAEAGVVDVTTPDTNIVLFDIGRLHCSPADFVSQAGAAGVHVLRWRGAEIRAVFDLRTPARDAVLAAERLIGVARRLAPSRQYVLSAAEGTPR